MKIFLVGGAVRDKLMGESKPHDRDFVVVGSCREEMEFLGFQKVGADFPIFLHPETKEEYALARKERKTGPGYRGFEVMFDSTVTLLDDLSRRDFTINSIAEDEDGYLIDPFGGIADMKAGILRATCQKSFSEDPLRVLRLVRFATRFGFKIDEETESSARKAVPEIVHLSQERITSEIVSAIRQAKKPSDVIRLLEHLGVLQIVLPELSALRGIPQPEKHHPEGDVLEHVLQALDFLKDRTSAKIWAVLFHDCGKAKTDPHDWPRHIGHETIGVPIARHAMGRLKASNKEKSFVVKVTELHMKAHRWDIMRPGSLFEWFQNLGVLHHPELLQDFLDVFDADWNLRGGGEKRRKFLTKALDVCRSVKMDGIVASFTTESIKNSDRFHIFIKEKHRSMCCDAIAKLKQLTNILYL